MRSRGQGVPATYYIMRGGRILRRPHEGAEPFDPRSPLATFDFAASERAIAAHYRLALEET